MGLCLLGILSLSYKLLAQGHGLWQSLLPNPWSIEELFQDDNLLVSTKAFLFCFEERGEYMFLWMLWFFPFSREIKAEPGS